MNTPDDSEPRKRGRRTKLTPGVAMAIIYLIQQGHFRAAACQRAGVSVSTLNRWLKMGTQYPDGIYAQFRQGLLEAESKAEIDSLNTILNAGKTEDWKASAWYLERKYPQRYGRQRGELRELEKQVAELKRMIEAREAEPL